MPRIVGGVRRGREVVGGGLLAEVEHQFTAAGPACPADRDKRMLPVHWPKVPRSDGCDRHTVAVVSLAVNGL
jgi:hypothetical protein